MGGETSFSAYTFACVNHVIELAATCMGETQQSEITQLSTAGFNSLHAEVIYTFQFSNAEIGPNQRCHSEGQS